MAWWIAPEDPGMAKPLLPDALWEKVEPLLPRPKRRRFRYPGRKPLTPRQALTGILFVLRTGIRWNDLPCEMGCGSGSRCRRYLKTWHRARVWDPLHALLLAELDEDDYEKAMGLIKKALGVKEGRGDADDLFGD